MQNLRPTNLRPTSDQLRQTVLTDNQDILTLIKAIGTEELSVKQIMEKIGMKHRRNFTENYLLPALENGFVRMLYPDKPNHPRQRYLLTVKGTVMLNDTTTQKK